jgi:hypothetical protein
VSKIDVEAQKKNYLTNNQYSAALIDFVEEGETPTPQSGEDFRLHFCSINKGCEANFLKTR